MSKIELGVRHTSVVWDWLNVNDVTLPPTAKWPPGVQQFIASLASSSQGAESSNAMMTDSVPGKKSPDKEGEVCLFSSVSSSICLTLASVIDTSPVIQSHALHGC